MVEKHLHQGTDSPRISHKDLRGSEHDKKALTAGETINGDTLPVAVYIKDSDDEVYACDGNVVAALNFIGFAVTNSTDGKSIDVQMRGIVKGFSGLDIGKEYFVQDDKTIGTTPGTYLVKVGIAVAADEIFIQRELRLYGTKAISASGASGGADVSQAITVDAQAKILSIDVTHAHPTKGAMGHSPLIVFRDSGKYDEKRYVDSTDQLVRIYASLSGTTLTITAEGDAVGGQEHTLSGTIYELA